MVNELTAFFLTRDAWRDWIPTVTQGVGVTVNAGYVARWDALANLVIVELELTVGSAGTAANDVVIGGIASAWQPANTGTFAIIGTGGVFDPGTPNVFRGGILVATAATSWKMVQAGASGYVGTDPNFALASGDQISLKAIYER